MDRKPQQTIRKCIQKHISSAYPLQFVPSRKEVITPPEPYQKVSPLHASGSISFMQENALQQYVHDYNAGNLETKSELYVVMRENNGIAAQIHAICDAVLLGIAYRVRVHLVSSIVTHELFDTPIKELFVYRTNEEISVLRYGDDRELVDINVHSFDVFDNGTYATILEPSLVHKSEILLVSQQFSQLLLNSTLFASIPLPQQIYGRYTKSRSYYMEAIPILLPPSPFIRRLLQPYRKEMKGRYVIGAHLRIGGFSKLSSFKDTTRFLEDFSLYHALAMLRHGLQKKNSILAIATDSSKVERMIKAIDMNRTVIVTYGGKVHSGVNSEKNGVIQALLEMLLLGDANELILTRGSGMSQCIMELSKRSRSIMFMGTTVDYNPIYV